MARAQKVIVEYHDGGYLTLFDDGDIQMFGTPAQALKAIKKAAHRTNDSVTVTTIEWRNTPEGFIQPT